MANLSARLVGEIKITLKEAPCFAVVGAVCGYFYGKLANLPAGQAAKALAIWSAAEVALLNLSCAFSENRSTLSLIRALSITICGTIGVHEMRKRGLMGDKLMKVMVGIRIFVVSIFLLDAMFNE